MNTKNIGRMQILNVLTNLGDTSSAVRALWEGGSAAFGRIDEWSDIDLQFLVEDNQVELVLRQIQGALEQLLPLKDSFAVPEPTWHGHSQQFYRLKDASEFMIIDCIIVKRSQGPVFLEPERHGIAKV